MILFLTSILFLPPNPAPPPFFRLDKVENLVYLGWFLEGRGILKLSETSWMCSSPNIHLFAGVCHCLTRSYLFRQWDQLIGRTSSWLFLFAWVFKGLCPFSLPKMLKKKKSTNLQSCLCPYVKILFLMVRDGNHKSSGKNGQNKIFFNCTELLQRAKIWRQRCLNFRFQFLSVLQIT